MSYSLQCHPAFQKRSARLSIPDMCSKFSKSLNCLLMNSAQQKHQNPSALIGSNTKICRFLNHFYLKSTLVMQFIDLVTFARHWDTSWNLRIVFHHFLGQMRLSVHMRVLIYKTLCERHNTNFGKVLSKVNNKLIHCCSTLLMLSICSLFAIFGTNLILESTVSQT